MAELYESAGATAWVLLLLTMAAVPTALLMLGLSLSKKTVRGALLSAGVVAGFALAAVFIGLKGQASDLVGSYKAATHAYPDDAVVILERAELEARANATLGMLVGGPLALLSAAVVAVAFARTRSAA